MTDRYLFRGFHPCENGTESVWIEGKEIKGEWLYGDLIQYSKEEMSIRSQITNDYTKCMSVLPETVGQYTGWKLNKKKVFEDDIINIKYTGLYDTQYYALCVIQDGSVSLEFNDKYGGQKLSHDIKFSSAPPHKYELVGNIHSNPDILERKEKEE